MDFIDHIRACNQWDPTVVRPFVVNGRRVGSIVPGAAAVLARHPEVFIVTADRVGLVPELCGADAIARAIAETLRPYAGHGGIAPWRGEAFAVGGGLDGPPLFLLERCLVTVFGTRAYGIHVNGFVRSPDGDPAKCEIWVARRALNDRTFPGKLDHLVAGGHAAGYAPTETLVKEAEEEAGIPEALARTARPVGTVAYRLATECGLRDDVLLCYDLALPAAFQPVNTDGEVGSFARLPVAEVIALVRDGWEFKFNVPLVIIDFLIRHGLIAPDHPDYEALCLGLRGIPV